MENDIKLLLEEVCMENGWMGVESYFYLVRENR